MHYKEKLAQQFARRRAHDLEQMIITHIPKWKLSIMQRFQRFEIVKKWFGYEFHENLDGHQVSLWHRGKMLAKNY